VPPLVAWAEGAIGRAGLLFGYRAQREGGLLIRRFQNPAQGLALGTVPR
jgi:hypothetical protein